MADAIHAESNGTFGSRLKAVRIKRLMTQRELAEASGVSQVTISFLENDISMPMELTAEKLARALKTSAKKLRYGGSSDEAIQSS